MNTKDLFKKLKSLAEDSPKTEFQKRGRDFEKILIEILSSDKLNPETSFRPKGEELDGFFHDSCNFYLFEAKWHKSPIPASQIYAFKGKLDGKFQNTIGVYFSVSGYSKDCIEALQIGKGLNIILFDGDDIEAIINNQFSFQEALLIKRKEASKRGIVFYKLTATELSLKDKINHKSIEPYFNKEKNIAIVCEGPLDRIVIQAITEKLMLEFLPEIPISIIPAGGLRSIPKIINSLKNTKGIAIFDSDMKGNRNLRNIQSEIESDHDFKLVQIEPDIEIGWLRKSKEAIYSEAGSRHEQRYWKFVNEYINSKSISQLKEIDPSLKLFIDSLESMIK